MVSIAGLLLLLSAAVCADQEPFSSEASRELTDASFEHLTQAASGSTTGPWFVMFYSKVR